MEKLIEIKIPKGTLFLTYQELLQVLPIELIEKGLRRGKYILRRRNFAKRQEQAKNRNSERG